MQRKQNKYDTWGNNQKLHKSFINTIKPWTLNGDCVAVVLICDSWHSRLDACMSDVCFLFSFSHSRTAQVTHAIFGWLQHWRENYNNDLRLNFKQQKGRQGEGMGRGRAQCYGEKRQTASTLGRQLRLNVHPADGALLVGEEPLIHTQLMEEVHTR